MDLRVLTRLLIKLAGAAVIVWGVASISNIVIHVLQLNREGVSLAVLLLAAVLPVAIPIIIGAFLLTFPGVVANAVVRGEDLAAPSGNPLRGFETIVYSLFGLYLIANALSDSVYHYSKFELYRNIIDKQGYVDMPKVLPQDFAAMIASAAELVMGVVLVLGAPGLARLFSRLRGRREEY